MTVKEIDNQGGSPKIFDTFINPLAIRTITDKSEDGYCKIIFIDGSVMAVKDEYDAVVNCLRNYLEKNTQTK